MLSITSTMIWSAMIWCSSLVPVHASMRQSLSPEPKANVSFVFRTDNALFVSESPLAGVAVTLTDMLGQQHDVTSDSLGQTPGIFTGGAHDFLVDVHQVSFISIDQYGNPTSAETIPQHMEQASPIPFDEWSTLWFMPCARLVSLGYYESLAQIGNSWYHRVDVQNFANVHFEAFVGFLASAQLVRGFEDYVGSSPSGLRVAAYVKPTLDVDVTAPGESLAVILPHGGQIWNRSTAPLKAMLGHFGPTQPDVQVGIEAITDMHVNVTVRGHLMHDEIYLIGFVPAGDASPSIWPDGSADGPVGDVVEERNLRKKMAGEDVLRRSRDVGAGDNEAMVVNPCPSSNCDPGVPTSGFNCVPLGAAAPIDYDVAIGSIACGYFIGGTTTHNSSVTGQIGGTLALGLPGVAAVTITATGAISGSVTSTGTYMIGKCIQLHMCIPGNYRLYLCDHFPWGGPDYTAGVYCTEPPRLYWFEF